MRYETLLFDFHGTLTSNRGRLAVALNAAFKEIAGTKITKADFQRVLNREEGATVAETIHQMLADRLEEAKRKALVEKYLRHNDRVYVPKYRHVIKQLSEIGVQCAIVTNGVEGVVRQALGDWGILNNMVGVYGTGQGSFFEGKPKKPSSTVIEAVIENLRNNGHTVRRDRTLMIGDYVHDIAAGNNAGIHTALLLTGPNQDPSSYNVRPTHILLDYMHSQPTSEWIQREGGYSMRDLPALALGTK